MRTRRRGATISSGDPRGMHRGWRDDENTRERDRDKERERNRAKKKGRFGEREREEEKRERERERQGRPREASMRAKRPSCIPCVVYTDYRVTRLPDTHNDGRE